LINGLYSRRQVGSTEASKEDMLRMRLSWIGEAMFAIAGDRPSELCHPAELGWSVSSVNCRYASAGFFRLPRSPHGHKCIHISIRSASSRPLYFASARPPTAASRNDHIYRHRGQRTWARTCGERPALSQRHGSDRGERPHSQSSRLV
jgi:hypothetical protein